MFLKGSKKLPINKKMLNSSLAKVQHSIYFKNFSNLFTLRMLVEWSVASRLVSLFLSNLTAVDY